MRFGMLRAIGPLALILLVGCPAINQDRPTSIPKLSSKIDALSIDVWQFIGKDNIKGKYKGSIIRFHERVVFSSPSRSDDNSNKCYSKFYTFHYHLKSGILELIDPENKGYTGVVVAKQTHNSSCENIPLEDYRYLEDQNESK